MKQDPFELALFLTGDEENWEDAIEEKYSISYGDFEALVNDLLPRCFVRCYSSDLRTMRGFPQVAHFLFSQPYWLLWL